jgi:hypothetical protein
MTGKGKMEFEEKKMLFEGEFLGGFITGKGKMNFSNGMTYDGEWLDDQFTGEGILYMGDGRLLKGTWNEGGLVDGSMYANAESLQIGHADSSSVLEL